MPQPLPRTQCGHHTPGSLPKSATAITLQHNVQLPHARPGTTRDSARAAASCATGEPAEKSISDVMPIASVHVSAVSLRSNGRAVEHDRHQVICAPRVSTYTA